MDCARKCATVRRWGWLLGALMATAAAAQQGQPGATPAAPAPNEPALGTTIVHPADGALMVYVPAGFFRMGFSEEEARKLAQTLGDADPARYAPQEWYPARRVFVEGYFIDKHEVTWELWNRFRRESGVKPKLAKAPESPVTGNADLYPATSVRWAEAQQYANWWGKRLPTEAQWEKAARGTDGRFFPWGNQAPTDELANIVQHGHKDIGGTAMVGSRPKGVSPCGALDMAGNVLEWTCEFMEPYMNNPRGREVGTSVGGHRFGVLRGGSFYMPDFQCMSAKRFGFEPDETYYHVGLRTVWAPPEGYFESDAFKRDREKVAAREAEIEAMRKKAQPQPSNAPAAMTRDVSGSGA